jgi:hypothetical protein
MSRRSALKKRSRVRGRLFYQLDPVLFSLPPMAGRMSKEPVFILGNGPSIEKQQLSLVKDFFTIGINRIFLIHEPTILLWQDPVIWVNHHKQIWKLKSIKVTKKEADPEGVCVHFRQYMGSFQLSKDPGVLYGCGNSGALAVQLAIALGCSPIVLLGMDCKYIDKQTNFYGVNKDHTNRTLKSCYRGLTWIKKKCPVEVISCSDDDVFEKTEDLPAITSRYKAKAKGLAFYKQLFHSVKLG